MVAAVIAATQSPRRPRGGVRADVICDSFVVNSSCTVKASRAKRGATMRARASAAVVAALAIGAAGAASAACPRHRAQNCLVNLTLAPAVSRQIVAGEKISAPPAKAPPPVQEIPAYTGPTIGTVPNVPRAPEIGYRWSIN
jgi:hypothetical protein